MTAPLRARVSVAASASALAVLGSDDPEGAILTREGPLVILVAKGDTGRALEEALRGMMEKDPKP